MGKPEFTTLPTPEQIALVRVKVRDLGFTDPNRLPTTTEVLARAQEFGLGPAEVGPHLRLTLTDQPNGDVFWIAMKPISDSGGFPRVFCLRRGGGGRWLDAAYAYPDDQWNLEGEIVFSLRKPQ